MIDFLLCEQCESIITSGMNQCPCCKMEIRESLISVALLAFCEHLDDPINKTPISIRLMQIEQSPFKKHPALVFRRAKFLLLEAIAQRETLTTDNFFRLLKFCVCAASPCPHYWDELSRLLCSLLPSPYVAISKDEAADIIHLTQSSYKECDKLFGEKLKLQLTD